MEMKRKEVVDAYFKVLFQKLPAEAQENHGPRVRISPRV
jgi:hypothetical protein